MSENSDDSVVSIWILCTIIILGAALQIIGYMSAH